MSHSTDLEVRITGNPDGAINAMVKVGHHAGEMASEVAAEVAKMAATFFTLEKGIEAIGEGIKKADEIRDLTLSLNVFTGSVNRGRESMEFFERAAANTRQTGVELATLYRDVLPLAISRGFSQESMQQITVRLSQLSTIAGTSAEQMDQAFGQLLSGRVSPGRNALLKVLGITKADVANLGWDELVTKMDEVAGHFPEFGQSFESAMHKSKEAWLEAFGAGFNEAMDNGRTAAQTLTDTLSDPKMLEAVRSVGAEVAKLITTTAEWVKTWSDLRAQMRADSSKTDVAPWVQNVADWINNDFGYGAYSTPKLTRNVYDKVKAGGGRLNPLIGDESHGYGYQLGGMAPDFGPADYKAGPGFNFLAQDTRESAQETDHLTQNLKALGHVAIDTTKKLGDLTRALPHGKNLAGFGMAPFELTPSDFSASSYAQMLSVVDPAIHQRTLDYARAQAAPMLAIVDPEVHRRTIEIAKEAARAQAEEYQRAIRNSNFVSDFGAMFSSVVQSGGRDFVAIIASGMRNEVADGVKVLSDTFFGAPGDSSKGQDPNRRYSASGADVTGRAAAGRAVLGGAEIAFGGYQAGYSGAPGARTGATLSGAAAGAGLGAQFGSSVGPIGTLYGAIIGAIVGAIGGAVGAAQRQSEYKYLVPMIDDKGTASLTQTKNIQLAEQQAITARIQGIYDAIRDSLVLTLAKIPGAVVPDRVPLNGMFQPEGSAHTLEHLAQWEAGELPREAMAGFKTELTNTVGVLGMSADRFTAIWDHLQKIDPTKAVGLLDTLFTALEQHSQLMRPDRDLRHGLNPVTGELDFTASALWYGGNQARMTSAQAISEADAQIVQLAAHIKDLSGEGQIQAFQQLVSMEQQRNEMLKSAAMELYQLAKNIHDELRGDQENIDVLRLRKADGSPDNYGVAQYYKDRARFDLSSIGGAQNATEAQAAFERYRHDILTGGMAGYNQASEADKNKWLDWMQEQLGLGSRAVDAAISRFGTAIDQVNADFNAKFDPAINAFTGAAGGASTSLDNLGGAVDRIIGPIDRVGIIANDTANSINDLNAAVVNLTAYIATIRAQNSGGGTNLAANTRAARAS